MLPDMQMTTLDLENAYLLIPILESYRRFLCFQWRKRMYEFTALPFKLSTVPYIFTNLLRPVVTFLRNKGHQSVIYLEDFILLRSSNEEYRANVHVSINPWVSKLILPNPI